MKRRVTETRAFTKELNKLLKNRKLLQSDFDAFKRTLVENPHEGEIIQGTGGVRKTRLKSSSKGKSGGARVCYYDDSNEEEIFLLRLYAKNVQEDLTAEEKKY